MKYSRIISFLSYAISALCISGCGADVGNANIGGTVVGLSGGTTVGLLNNGTDPINVSANGSFTFDQQLESGTSYNVTVDIEPVGETCSVFNGTGTIDQNADGITTVTVSCVVAP